MIVDVKSANRVIQFFMDLKAPPSEDSGQSLQMVKQLETISLVESRRTAARETSTADELRANGIAVFVLKLVDDASHDEKQEFKETFGAKPDSVFKEDATTLCGIATVDSFEITVYGTRFESPMPTPSQQQQPVQVLPPYPWPWKFLFEPDRYQSGETVRIDRQTCFDWDYDLTNWARSLGAVSLKSLGVSANCHYLDVYYCDLVSNYFETSGASPGVGDEFRVYLPPGTKECWDKVHRESTTKRRWVVSGSPGIGKSISTIYYLLLLIKAKRPIILYEMRRQKEPANRWFLFALHPDGYHCFRPNGPVVNASFWMGVPDCSYIVDLNQQDANLGAQKAQTVLVTTPDPSKKNGDYGKESVSFAYVPVPPNSIVRAIAYDWVEKSSTGPVEANRKKMDIQKKMYQVGPIFRRLLDQSEYDTAIQNIKGAFEGIECEHTIKAIMSPNLIQLCQGKKPHSYLLMITKREYVDGDFLKEIQLRNDEAEDNNGEDDSTEEDATDDANEEERASETAASPATVTAPPVAAPETADESKEENKEAASVPAPEPAPDVEMKEADSKPVYKDGADAAEGLVVVPVCREAVAMALDNSKGQTAKLLLSRMFPHLRKLQGGAGFEDWIILAACNGILEGKAYQLSGKGPVANDAVPHAFIFGDGLEHKEGKKASREESIDAWLSLCPGSGVAGSGTGMVQPNNGFPLVDFMDRKDRGGQITLDKAHSVVVGKLSKKRKNFGWAKATPLHVLYIVSELSFSTFCLDREPPNWIKAYVVNAGDLTVRAPQPVLANATDDSHKIG